MAEQVRRLAVKAAEARALAERAEEQAAHSERELAERLAGVDGANDSWVAESRAWRTAVLAWTRAEVPVPDGEVADWDVVHRALGNGAADAEELAAIPAMARAVLTPLQQAARRVEAAAGSSLAEAERELEAKEAERASLEAEKEARPPRSRFQAAERDGRAGAPFYELVDVVPGITVGDQAGLEAALEASGLLDAWVPDHGMIIHPSTQDVILRPEAPRLPPGMATLADVLVSDHPHVASLLGAVALGERDGHPWVTLDGRWSIGPLRGAWTKPDLEYLGAGTRRATRERRLAELTRQCEARRAAAEAASQWLRSARHTREVLDQQPATLPDSASVRAAASRAEALAEVARGARARHDRERRAAEHARTAAAQATTELTHTAGRDSLPVAVGLLDAVARAAGELGRELRAWERGWSELGRRQAAAGAAAGRRRERDQAARGAAERARALWQDHAGEAASLMALEQALEATVAQVLAAIEECERRRDQAARELPGAEHRARAAAVAEGQARQAMLAANRAVESAAGAVAAAGERLVAAACLPGVIGAALGVDGDGSSQEVGYAGSRSPRARWRGPGPCVDNSQTGMPSPTRSC